MNSLLTGVPPPPHSFSAPQLERPVSRLGYEGLVEGSVTCPISGGIYLLDPLAAELDTSQGAQ